MLSYTIDTSDVRVFVQRMALESDAATTLFFLNARYKVQEILVETVEQLSNQEGFPPDYQAHLIEQIILNPPVVVSSDFVEVDLNLLGTYEQYAMGFHRHAISADNERINLPYTGQALKYEEDVRTEAWENKVVGTFLYNDTIDDRVNVWRSMGVAPEWWVLQNGSPDDPRVDPTPLEELISAKLETLLAPVYEEAMQEAVNRADHGWATTSTGGLRHNLRDPSTKRFIKR